MISFDDTKLLMQKAVDHFSSEIASIRTGRAVPSLVEDIVCPAYGGTQRLTVKELAGITASDLHTLLISPWDPSVVGEIRKGIMEANVGLNPVLDNNNIRISVPVLTTERREEYAKILRQKLEDSRVAIRNIRQDKLKDIRTAFESKDISEDEKFRHEEELQKITDEFTKKAEALGDKKEQEILAI